MNNQELLYKIATDQRYADTLRLAIQVQASLRQMRKTAEVDEGVRSAIAAGKKRHEDNKKKKEAQTAKKQQGGNKQPQKQEPAKTEQADTNKPTVTTEQAFDKGKATGYGQAASSAIHGVGGALAGRYTFGGIGSQIGRLIAWARNSGARSVLNGMNKQYTVPLARANAAAGTPSYTMHGVAPQFNTTNGTAVTIQNLRNGMAARTADYRAAGGRIGRGIGTWAGGIGGLALSGLTNNWLSNYIKSQFGNAA